MERETCLDKRMYDISKYAGVIEIILISLGIFLVPLIIPQVLSIVFGATSSIATNSQYVVGTIVNASLIIAGVNVKGLKKIIGLVTLPSISAILSGFVFGTASIFTIYMIPFIWIANFALIYLFKKLLLEKKLNYVKTASVGILAKASVIFAGFNLLLATGVIASGTKVAEMLYLAMGVNQLITATLGSVLAFATLKVVYKRK